MPDKQSAEIEAFIDTLPDPAGARAFVSRLEAGSLSLANEGASESASDRKEKQLLLSRLLVLAGNSPFLAETLLRHPDNITWLRVETERNFDRIKSREELSEELARFVTRVTDVDNATRLARFKRRELLRIYLRDCLGIATLSEVTEELSILADVILSHGLALAHQELINIHGTPQAHDARGRIEKSELAIVALGKLGCRELNYASDIDLLFLYSANGETSGDGRNPESAITNKEFFTRMAERVVQLIGRSSEEGAVYRIDLRLRPYGRDGDLVWEIERAAEYYRNRAHNWERQALIRARASAGSEALVARFLEKVLDSIFTKDALPDTLEGVRRGKEKIDKKEAARSRGFNVKLGQGGIREIEFIAQALQLKHGGREPWVRSAQTLIVLARLAEKDYLSEVERAKLSAAYTFLRTVEHRLQMEHGAQTHTLPQSRAKIEMLARRCGFTQADDVAGRFMKALQKHTSEVRAIYNRVFVDAAPKETSTAPTAGAAPESENARLIRDAAARLSRVIAISAGTKLDLDHILVSALPIAINPSRSVRNVAAWANSFATYAPDQIRSPEWMLCAADWSRLIERLTLVLSSQYLAHLLISRPTLASALVADVPHGDDLGFLQKLRASVALESGSAHQSDALRREWYRLLVELGYRDMSVVNGPWSVVSSPLSVDEDRKLTDHGLRTKDYLRVINLAQTALAEAVLKIGLEIALESIGLPNATEHNQLTNYSLLSTGLPFAILGLGRLGHAGMDYGSDLDLLIVFDDEAAWPPASLSNTAELSSPREFYSKLASQLVHVLSSLTREGLLYRTDLRLRPEGKSGPVALGLNSLVAYLTERASAWEHSAYLKAREVAGNLEFGERARAAICKACFDAASRNETLREDLRDMRTRQVKEKARGNRPDIKWGRGGMTDVYFVTRYLQLRDRIYFPPENGTAALVARLGELGALDGSSAARLFEGYTFLRRLDHWMRLLLDRPSPSLPASSIARRDLTRALGLPSVSAFEEAFAHHSSAIREVYDGVFG
jgi:[glutamine synthetase] adenylyltransferase / [glutamine synthetase]-adenylyl-L-tyrosine phosphorylase